MNNPIRKIMSTRYKYVFVAVIIMIIVFVLGAVVIQGMNNIVADQSVTYTDTVVLNKYLDESNGRFYVVVGNNNQTFDIVNDNQGTKMFDKIATGKHYRFVIQNDTKTPMMHIIQVYNDTN